MAYVDAQLLLSDAQALTFSTNSTNHVNLGSVTTYLGTGSSIALVVSIDVTAGGTAPTLTIGIQTDDNTSFASPATAVQSATFVAAQVVAGAQFVVALPSGLSTEKFIRAYYTLGGTAPTVTVTSSLKPLALVGDQHYFPNAYEV